MLRHKQFNRSFKHNLLLAILFSIVAGMINVTGLIIFNVFTTNLTGHVGEFAFSVYTREWASLIKVLNWILSFLAGAFVASFLTNVLERVSPRVSYVVPVIVEIGCLLIVILPDFRIQSFNQNELKLLLLFFSMGLQNGIVSVVSGNVVRTTHLTGMLTDFGIGLSEWMINKEEKRKNKEKVVLSGTIIFSFLLGGILSAYFTPVFSVGTIFIPIGVLLFVISFDFLKMRYLILKRKISDRNKA